MLSKTVEERTERSGEVARGGLLAAVFAPRYPRHYRGRHRATARPAKALSPARRVPSSVP